MVPSAIGNLLATHVKYTNLLNSFKSDHGKMIKKLTNLFSLSFALLHAFFNAFVESALSSSRNESSNFFRNLIQTKKIRGKLLCFFLLLIFKTSELKNRQTSFLLQYISTKTRNTVDNNLAKLQNDKKTLDKQVITARVLYNKKIQYNKIFIIC